MSDGAIQIYNGDTSGPVTKKTNVTGQMTPILQVSPDRGNILRVENMVTRGEQIGVPVYMDLRDSNDNPLADNTKVQWEFSPSNSDSLYRISRRLSNIAHYNDKTVAEQTDVDVIDRFKQVLTEPEFEGSDPVRFIQWSDIEDVYLSISSASQIDWGNSIVEVEPTAVKGPFTRGR